MLYEIYYKYKQLTTICVFAFLLIVSLVSLNNNLKNNITRMHVDEVHTIIYAVESMSSGKVTNLRVGESTRWLARAIIPMAIYYMNSNMGGAILQAGDWTYSSGYYLKRHLKTTSSINKDPNIQDFVFAMRFILGTFVIFSFLVVSYFMSRIFGLVAGVAYFVLPMSTLLVNQMLQIFYTESTMIILFNLMLVLLFSSNINKYRLYIYSAFIFSLSVSAKLTGIVYILPIAVLITIKDSNAFKGIKLEGFMFLSIVFFLLINILSSSYIEVLNQTLSNIYHYKTGHRYSTPSGMYQLKLVVDKLVPWVYLAPFSLLYLFFVNFKYKKFILFVALSSFIMIVALIGVNFFMPRNLTTPLVMFLFVFAISLSIVTKKYTHKLNKIPAVVVLGLIIFYGYYVTKNYESIDASSIIEDTKNCTNIALIDVNADSFPNASVIKDIPDKILVKRQQKIFRDKYLPYNYDCILVKRINRNKQYTNYLLPLDYLFFVRKGDYFVFKSKESL